MSYMFVKTQEIKGVISWIGNIFFRQELISIICIASITAAASLWSRGARTPSPRLSPPGWRGRGGGGRH